MIQYNYIENEAFSLLRDIWRAKERLWPNGVPRPNEMIEPSIAAQLLGMRYAEHEELRGIGSFNTGYEIAGQIDRQRGEIAVSRRFSQEVMRFTGGHELGHAMLHPTDKILHRDPPISGVRDHLQFKEQRETEADFFAACFLMPAGLVTQKLEETFGISSAPFVINDTSAFLLSPSNQAYLMGAPPGSLIQESAIASAGSYGRSGRFVSLAEQFRVSVKSMAIRLSELKLVA